MLGLVTTVVARAQLPRLSDGLTLSAEGGTTLSDGDFAPLWLTANRQGIVSPYASSGYERIGMSRSVSTDSLWEWRIGYGLDLQLNQNAQSDFFVQQAYAEAEWKCLRLTVGQKERSIDLRNNALTSGGLSQGINARPLPEVLLNVDYVDVPGTKGWAKVRGRIGYGIVSDGAWQRAWVADRQTLRYTSNYLYHEKAGYLKLGREEAQLPMTFEAGLQMMTQFGGTNYNTYGRTIDGTSNIHNSEGLKDYWNAFWPFGSSDVTDGTMHNVKGNMLGSWNMALTWHGKGWMARGYFERYFDDHSQLFIQYGFTDHLLGAEVQLPRNPFVTGIVIEHLSTADQSGAVYHDHTPSMPETIAARDNYYNHNLYSGWQAWGMSMGSPLLTSPIYNKEHRLTFANNRVRAWHFGLSGDPSASFSWRALLTLSQGWGTYEKPLDDVAHETHLLMEATYRPVWAEGWSGTLATGLTRSPLMGNSNGFQLTVRKLLHL